MKTEMRTVVKPKREAHKRLAENKESPALNKNISNTNIFSVNESSTMDDCCSFILNVIILCVVFLLGKNFGYKRAYGDGIKACVKTIQAQGFDETYNQGYQAGLHDSISITVHAGGYEYNSTNTTTTSISAILGAVTDDDYARTVIEDALDESVVEDKHSFGAVEVFQCFVLITVAFICCACFFRFAVSEYDKAYPSKAKRDGNSDNDSDAWTKETALTTTTAHENNKSAWILQESDGISNPNAAGKGLPEKENSCEVSDGETASSGSADTRTDEGYIAPNTFQYIIQSDLA